MSQKGVGGVRGIEGLCVWVCGREEGSLMVYVIIRNYT